MFRTYQMTSLYLFLFLFGVCFSLEAAQYDLKTMTPEVQQAISNRQSRYDALQNLKSQGAVGENNRGYTEVRQSIGDAVLLTSVENSDRKVIYQAIADQNNLGAQGLSVIETVFAEVQRDKARSGDPIQMPSGEWSQK